MPREVAEPIAQPRLCPERISRFTLDPLQEFGNLSASVGPGVQGGAGGAVREDALIRSRRWSGRGGGGV